MKARIKSYEEMPDYAKCCFESNEAMKPFCGTEVDLRPQLVETRDVCHFCGLETIGLGFIYTNGMFSLKQDMIDIDEGLVN